TQPADGRLRLPSWKATPPGAKNTEFSIGALLNSLLLWCLSFHSTWKKPFGVGSDALPGIIGTGPYLTLPLMISHACPVRLSTHAAMVALHGVPGALPTGVTFVVV